MREVLHMPILPSVNELPMVLRPDPSSAVATCAVRRRRADAGRAGRVLVAVVVSCLWAVGAAALEGIDLSGPSTRGGAEETGSGCSRLVSIKYPFLRCGKSGEIGLAEGDATWENSRRLPLQSEWIEGEGAWGPELNLE